MKFPKLTIRFLSITLVIFLVMVVLSAATFLLELNGIVERLGRAYALERAQAERSQIADLLEREAALAKKLADSPIVKRWMLDEPNTSYRATAFREMESYRRAFLDSNYFLVVGSSLHYYNQPKTGPLETTTLEPQNRADAWYFSETAAGSNVTFNLDYNRLIGAAKVWINCLVRSGGKIIGMAGTGIDITDLVHRLISAEGSGASSMLVDYRGVITLHPNVGYLEYNADAGAGGKKITVFDLAASRADRAKLRSLIDRAVAGEAAVGVVNLQGHSSLTAAAPIPEIRWIMISSIDTSSLISLRDFLPLLAVLLVSLLLALVTVALIMDRMVLRPLGTMTVSARRIAAGDYSPVLPAERRDEIGTLSATFSEMASRVKNYTESLEAQVEERTAELQKTNKKLEESTRQVLESIRYARFIQEGLMPTAESLASHFAACSLFHRQRDGVGGDFLVLRDLGPEAGFLLAVIDCEGHGVSGALMTMMAASSLHLIASGRDASDPAKILDSLEREILASLGQSGQRSKVQGGLEIGLCAVDPKTRSLLFAGAGLPLYVCEPDGSVVTVSGRRKAIGSRGRRRVEAFANQRFDGSGRTFYLVTDGFVDQPGGSSRRAYGTRRLFERIAACGGSSTGAACDGGFPPWEKEFDEYRGDEVQRDDVLLIGFRV